MNTKNNLKKYGIIYRITNDINGKIYIGQTIRNIEERFREHKKVIRNNYINRAIKKYGEKYFSIVEIDSADCQDELNYLEKYWIKFYNSQNKQYGYNIMDGGDGARVSKERRLERAVFFIKNEDNGQIFLSCKDASNFTGISAPNIHLCYSGKTRSAGGFIWKKISKSEVLDLSLVVCCDKKNRKADKISRKLLLSRWGKKDGSYLCKKIKCIETNEIWNSVKDAAKSIGISRCYFVNILHGRKSAKRLGKTFIYIN